MIFRASFGNLMTSYLKFRFNERFVFLKSVDHIEYKIGLSSKQVK